MIIRLSRAHYLGVSLLILITALSSDVRADQFNINFYGSFGSAPPAGWLEKVTLSPEQVAGADAWKSDGWKNISGGISTTAITSKEGKSATFRIAKMRNNSSFSSRKLREASTHNDGHATLLDCHLNTTEDPGDGSLTGLFEISEIPFAAYDLVLYLGVQRSHGFDGKGWIKINDVIEKKFVMSMDAPDWKYNRMTSPLTKGNYIVFRGLSGSNLKVEVAGNKFNHLGPSGLQIIEAKEARKPLKITRIDRDTKNKTVSVTWNSAPGEAYSLSYSSDNANFLPLRKPVIPASENGFSTTLKSIPCPVAASEKLFLRIDPPDYLAPAWDKLSGVGKRITLDFSEPILKESSVDTNNYSVTDENGNAVQVLSSGIGKAADRVVLRLATPLASKTSFDVTVRNVMDRAGRALTRADTKRFKTWDDNPKGVKVFILAGQSNMVGYGEVEKGHGGANGAIGSLRHLVNAQPEKYGRLVDEKKNWAPRSDVKFWWNRGRNKYVTGNLNVGYGARSTLIGPEYAFGQVIGDHVDEPVLIIKTAWGGKSLFADFRPPSAVGKRGGEVGFYYYEMLNNIHEVLDDFDKQFPEWRGKGYEIAGFGWHQGYNDSLNNFPASEYSQNIVDFITDVRDELGKPLLPFSLATTGHGGTQQKGPRLILTNSQLSIVDKNKSPQFVGNVAATDTRPFWREINVSPTTAGHHWYHNAETYYEIGEVLGRTMVELSASSKEKSK